MTQERRVVLNSNEIDVQESAGSYVIGADIGGTNLRLALADGAGAIMGRWSTSTVGARDAQAVVRLMREGVDTLLREASLPQHALRGIACGAPGITNVDSGIVIATSYLMGWRDVPLRALLEAEFKVPAAVDNDVNLAAVGEQRAGVAQGEANFVFLAIGTGIGAGIVVNGKILHGSVWTAGEVGYMLVPGTSEAPVELGEPGALEAIAGGEGIRNQWQKRWRADLTTLRKDAVSTEIFDQAFKSDALAQEVLQVAGRTLAYAIYNISLILNSPLFVLGGSVGIHPALGDTIRQVLAQRVDCVQPTLVRSGLGVDAQLIGAICLAIDTAGKKLVSPGN